MERCALYLETQLLTSELRVCSNFIERGRGLLWRPPLRAETGEALLIPACDAVHMLGMAYPICVLFLDRDGVILRIVDVLRPWRMARQAGARFALECAVGASWHAAVKPGDRLHWG
jgi:uncharacterized membrane protein (UPF0127 family)